MVSVAIDQKTGKKYYGMSGSKPENIHPILRKQMPADSHELWPINNCAEFDAVNNALKGGAKKMEDLHVYTVRTANNQPETRCENCKITTKGTHVYSD